jgi:Flp pilus assembly protein TadB
MEWNSILQLATPVGALVLFVALTFWRQDRQDARSVEREGAREAETNKREERRDKEVEARESHLSARLTTLEDRMHGAFERLIDQQGEIIVANTQALNAHTVSIREFGRLIEGCALRRDG